MHTVFIPALHRDLTEGKEQLEMNGDTVGAIVTQLEEQFPGIEARLVEDDRIRPHIAVAVNGEVSHRGLRQKLSEPSEIHFVPAMSGG